MQGLYGSALWFIRPAENFVTNFIIILVAPSPAEKRPVARVSARLRRVEERSLQWIKSIDPGGDGSQRKQIEKYEEYTSRLHLMSWSISRDATFYVDRKT